MKHYPHIISEFYSTPWAIDRRKLEAMTELVEKWRAGRGEFAAGQAITLQKAEAPQPRRSGSIAVLPIYGVIAPKMNLFLEFSGGTSIEQLTQNFREALADPQVKAIVFDVDSPGGSVFGVEELASEISAARGQKPIVAQVSPMAASAAYYLASQADEIAVTPTGEVGSIGVYAQHSDVSEMEKLKGVKTTLISAGRFKTEGNPHEPLTQDARDYMQSRVDEYYGMFVRAVARGRGVNPAQVMTGMGEGRMVGAQQALKLKMADRVATLEQTVDRLSGLTGASAVTMMELVPAADNAAVAAAASVPAEGSATVLVEMDALEALRLAARSVGSGPKSTAAPAVNPMEEQVEKAETTATANAAAVAERERVLAIHTLASRHNLAAEDMGKYISEGKSVEEVKSAILDKMQTSARPLAHAPAARVTSEHPTDLALKTKGARLARFARCVAAVPRGDKRAAAAYAMDVLRDPGIAAALGASAGSTGGYIVPDELSNEIIEFLRPYSVVRKLGPVLAPMANGSLALPKLAGGATAAYVGENQPLNATAPNFGQVKATAKKLSAQVAISNDLIRYAGPGLNADTIVRDDMAAAVGQAEDLAFIRGGGTAYSPKGLRNWALSSGVINSNQGNTLATTRSDVGKVKTQLRKGNVRFRRIGIIMSPRTENYLQFLADAQGKPVFYEEMTRRRYDVAGGGPGEENRGSGTGTFLGYPYEVTTQIPENLNTGVGSESELYIVDFADVVIAEVPTIVMEASTEAAYVDANSNLQSAFSLDQTVVRMIVEHDLVVRHQESIGVLAQVTWT